MIELTEQQKARFAIQALKGIALDPLDYARCQTWVKFCETHVTFCVRLHTVSLPFGLITLPAGEPLIVELQQAIEANRASRMFKAAVVYRRAVPKYNRYYGQLRNKALSVRRKHYSEFKNSDAADVAYDEYFEPRHKILNSHIVKLSAAATPAITGKGYTEWLNEIMATVGGAQ